MQQPFIPPKALSLSSEVIRMAKAQLLVNFRFLDSALFELNLEPVIQTHLATNGKTLYYHPMHMLEQYRYNQKYVVCAYLHSLLHCVFRHMFVSPQINQPIWDLACDVVIAELAREIGVKQWLESLTPAHYDVLYKAKTRSPILTAEKLYHSLVDNPLSEAERQKWYDLFAIDDHSAWYHFPEEDPFGRVADQDDSNPNDQPNDNPNGNSDGDINGNKQENPNPQDSNQPIPSPAQFPNYNKAEQEKRWQDISERLQTDLESFNKEHGDQAGGLLQNLRAVNREKCDYTTFLKKFATMREVMKLSPDEFDYVFYTYGLSLYKDMPLIEPLEYKEDKRIHDLVIAIDTSGSVQGELVQAFIQKTFNILKQEETFDKRFNLHLIQCDTTIQEHKVIHTQEEFDAYMQNMPLKGFGGTDFRPVFSYVEKLRAEKAFRHLKGLLYFTDGDGTYPEKKTEYETAFIFLDDDYTGQLAVPPWAMKVILTSEEIKNGSVNR